MTKLIEILESFGYPVFLQGSLCSDEDYPDSFFTFWNFHNEDINHYDNEPLKCELGYWVYFYSNDPALVYEKINEAKIILKSKGFTIESGPKDVNSGVNSHTGKMMTIYYIENYSEV